MRNENYFSQTAFPLFFTLHTWFIPRPAAITQVQSILVFLNVIHSFFDG